MNKKLYLEFMTDAGDETRISLNDPKEDLTSEEVQAQMAEIIAANIFDIKGSNLQVAVSAYTVEQIRTNHFGE